VQDILTVMRIPPLHALNAFLVNTVEAEQTQLFHVLPGLLMTTPIQHHHARHAKVERTVLVGAQAKLPALSALSTLTMTLQLFALHVGSGHFVLEQLFL
jgi:hypothetical protein